MASEAITTGKVYLGKLITFPNSQAVRFSYLDEKGQPLISDFDTRSAFDIWVASMCAEKYRAVFPKN